MMRTYYSRRRDQSPLALAELYEELCRLFLFLREQDYYDERGITKQGISDLTKRSAEFSLGFQPLPLTKWKERELRITESRVFDTIEFLFDCTSRPGEWGHATNQYGYNYSGYLDYDPEGGQEEFRSLINPSLERYSPGFELSESGEILSLVDDSASEIVAAELPSWDPQNVTDRIDRAVRKYRNRELKMSLRRSAVRDLADVFEWLKKNSQLQQALSKKDESALFEIVNNFAIRHHDPSQKSDYDESIWYAWMFHFYLATCHAVVRILRRQERDSPITRETDSMSSDS